MLNKIEGLLKARQLEFDRTDDDMIATGFSTQLENGSEHGFPLFIQQVEDMYGDSYIRFNIVPFIEQPYDGYPPSLYLMVGQVNHDLPKLKFAIDDDGDLELILDVPADELDDNGFDQALQILADYAGNYYTELASLVSV